MITPALSLIALLFAVSPADFSGTIDGVVLDGSHDRKPLAGAEVVLSVEEAGERVPVETTTSAPDGRFQFESLPLGNGIVYVVGVKRDGVDYFGDSPHFDNASHLARVTVVAYKATSAPCPLIVRSHDIRVWSEKGALYVSESLRIDNPSQKTFVGESISDMPPVTLRLSIPDDFEKVTFDEEFYGRQFMVLDGRVLTSLPWPPGERTVEFTYVLPINKTFRAIRRRLDLPTEQLAIRAPGSADCRTGDLVRQTRSTGNSAECLFTASRHELPAGHVIDLELGRLPVPLMHYARWASLLVLVAAMAASRWLPSGRSDR
jgi:hypothetical protein